MRTVPPPLPTRRTVAHELALFTPRSAVAERTVCCGEVLPCLILSSIAGTRSASVDCCRENCVLGRGAALSNPVYYCGFVVGQC